MAEVEAGALDARGYRVVDGGVEAVVAADFGPRVVWLGFTGGANLFAELPDVTQDTSLGTWRIRGGHRLWHSPEGMPRSYAPDNDPVSVELSDGWVQVSQNAEPGTGIAKSLRLTAKGDYFQVDHTLTNGGMWPVELAPWALSVMAPGGVALLRPAQARHPDNLLPNRLLALWPYTDVTDQRLTLGCELYLLRQAPAGPPIKIGLNSDGGWAAYWLDGQLLIKRFPFEAEGRYPDGGCTVECYANEAMLELESLGPLRLLEPGQSAYHTEQWYLFKEVALPLHDEKAALAMLDHYLSRTSAPG